jgi:exonuclease III
MAPPPRSPNQVADAGQPQLLGNLDISLAAQNCNSLNISTNCSKMLKKIAAITTMGKDIIFLSDIRLNRKNDNINDLKNAFLYNGSNAYNFFYNSSKSSRGVRILIKNNLDISDIDGYKDESENILGITCLISGKKIRLISIYGPNLDANTNFFINLRYYLDRDRNIPTVIGGDSESYFLHRKFSS